MDPALLKGKRVDWQSGKKGRMAMEGAFQKLILADDLDDLEVFLGKRMPLMMTFLDRFVEEGFQFVNQPALRQAIESKFEAILEGKEGSPKDLLKEPDFKKQYIRSLARWLRGKVGDEGDEGVSWIPFASQFFK